MENNSFQEIWDKIKSSQKILMTLHSSPDGDSLGSNLAMKYALEKLGKKVRVVSYDELSENLKDFHFVSEIEFGIDISEINFEEFDLLIFLDVASIDYVSGKIREKFNLNKKVFCINIDHHLSNTFFGDLNYVDKNRASCCSILIDLFKFINFELDTEISRRLLIGVCTDSLFFTTEEGESAVIEASFLINSGADYLEILKKIVYNESLKMQKYYAYLFDKLVIDKRGFGYSIISYDEVKKLGLNSSEVRLGINKLQFVKELNFVFDLIELEDHIKGSFRSKKGVDVLRFAKKLGGGGHKYAAAFRLPKMPLDFAKKKVLDVVDEVIMNEKII